MTSSQRRNRSRRATSHIAVRVAHVVLGGLVGVGWLVLPLGLEAGDAVTVARVEEGVPGRDAADGPGQDGTSAGDLVLPVVAVGAAVVLAAYASVRRTRRVRTRTTPGGSTPHVEPVPELDARTRRLLVETDDCVRTSAEELGCVAAQFDDAAVEPFAKALAYARSELATAFRLRQRLDEEAPRDARGVLEEIVLRCTEAGRRLDSEAAGFDLLRALERNAAAALDHAKTRFRELAARTPAIETALGDLHKRYAPSASLPVMGNGEHAKERLAFAAIHLERARQALDRGDDGRTAGHLRAAEAAVGQAALFVAGVDRLVSDLASASTQLPAVLTRLEAGLAAARRRLASAGVGELPGRVAHAESLLAGVRRDMAGGPYDPLDVLRRVAEAGTALSAEDAHEFLGQALLPARSALAGAEEFVTTHRGAVGCAARTRLAEAERHLALSEVRRGDGLAREGRELAERDVRAYGHPSDGAVLGGILLPGGAPAAFGGPRTRARQAIPVD